MHLTKIKTAVAVCSAVVVIGMGVGVFLYQTQAAPTVTLQRGDLSLTLAPNGTATHVEGLVLAMLGSCSVRNSQEANKDRWSANLKGDHVHIVYDNPRPVAITASEIGNAKDEVWQVSEIVVPLPAGKYTDYIFVRTGKGYGAFAKFWIGPTELLRKLVKDLAESDDSGLKIL